MFFIKKFVLSSTVCIQMLALCVSYKKKYDLVVSLARRLIDEKHTVLKAVINNNLIQRSFLLAPSYIYHFFKKSSNLLFLQNLRSAFIYIREASNRTFGFTYIYLQGFCFILFIDACLTDDEPLWEPIEWSLVQTWILFIFSFAWIAENLITSRYGSYTGRDKRVWFAWFKTFWLIEMYYIINYVVVSVFVITPFYFEVNYNLPFVYSWWNWYSKVFFFKFISLYTVVMLLAYYLQLSVRWLNWKKSLVLIVAINIFLSYLIYTQFLITFFSYFTDPIWFQKTRSVDYIQLSHEPSKWGWGVAKRDHFTHHPIRTTFWFKNDGPFAASFLLFQMFLFLCIFMLYIYWVVLFRRVYSTREVPLTYVTYCVSSLKQFFYVFLFLYFYVFFSYILNYLRLPIEYSWSIAKGSWLENLIQILLDYPEFLITILR